MSTVWSWLMAGSPAHYYYAALAVYVLVEYLLGESTKIKANSVLKVVLNSVAGFLYKLLPAVLQAAADKLSSKDGPGAPPGAPPHA